MKFWLGGPQTESGRKQLGVMPRDEQLAVESAALQAFTDHHGWHTAGMCWEQALAERTQHGVK